MTPMAPMEPMGFDSWWPAELGIPATSGSADSARYAYFPEQHRLVIENAGECTLFDTAGYQFRGFLQSSSNGGILTFLSQSGRVSLDALRKI